MAEVFGVVAGVVGVISLSIQLVDKLKQLQLHDDSQEVRQFVADLESSQTILKTAQNLVVLAQPQTLTSQTQLALSSLSLHIKDYSKELGDWVDQANAGGLFLHKTVKKSLFSNLSAARRFISSKSRSDSRMAIRDRVKFFENKMTLLIAVFGRELDFNHSTDIQKLQAHFLLFSQGISDEASSISDKLDHISKSSASILARSRSTEERLGDFQSEISSLRAYLQDFKTTMLDIASSASSKSEALSNLEEPKLTQNDISPFASLSKPEDSEDGSISAQSDFHDLAFETFSHTANLIARTSQEIFPPLVSEYFAALSSWDLLGRLLATLQHEQATQLRHPERSSIQRQEITVRDRSVGLVCRLLVLRKMCQREGYKQLVISIDAAFKVTEDSIDEWESLEASARQDTHSSSLLNFEAHPRSDTTSQTSVKVSTWLFTNLGDHAQHINLHKMIFSEIWVAMVGFRNYDSHDSPRPENTSDDAWKLLMLKYWFIDGAGDRGSGDITESFEAESVETDATIVLIQEESTEKSRFGTRMQEIDILAGRQADEFAIMREPPVPDTWVADTRYHQDSNEIPNNEVSAKQRQRAETDLDLYRAGGAHAVEDTQWRNTIRSPFALFL